MTQKDRNLLGVIIITLLILSSIIFFTLNSRIKVLENNSLELTKIKAIQKQVVDKQKSLMNNGFWEAELPTKKLDSLYSDIRARIKVIEYKLK